MANRRHSVRRASKPRHGRYNRGASQFVSRLLVMLAVVAAVLLGVAIFFRVQTVEVQGNRIYAPEQVAEASGVKSGDNLLMVNRGAVAGRVRAALPFVQEVSVGLILPDIVIVKVEESQIAGQVTGENGGTWYINTNGRVLGSSLEGFDGQLVEMKGVTLTKPAAGEEAEAVEGSEESLETALKIISAMEGTGLMEAITVVDTTETFDIELLCGEQYQILLGGTDEIEYKIQYLQVILEGLDPYQAGTIDLTFDQERVAYFTQWQ